MCSLSKISVLLKFLHFTLFLEYFDMNILPHGVKNFVTDSSDPEFWLP